MPFPEVLAAGMYLQRLLEVASTYPPAWTFRELTIRAKSTRIER